MSVWAYWAERSSLQRYCDVCRRATLHGDCPPVRAPFKAEPISFWSPKSCILMWFSFSSPRAVVKVFSSFWANFWLASSLRCNMLEDQNTPGQFRSSCHGSGISWSQDWYSVKTLDRSRVQVCYLRCSIVSGTGDFLDLFPRNVHITFLWSIDERSMIYNVLWSCFPTGHCFHVTLGKICCVVRWHWIIPKKGPQL